MEKGLFAIWDDKKKEWYFVVEVGNRHEEGVTSAHDWTKVYEQLDEILRTEALTFARLVGIDARLYPFSVHRGHGNEHKGTLARCKPGKTQREVG